MLKTILFCIVFVAHSYAASQDFQIPPRLYNCLQAIVRDDVIAFREQYTPECAGQYTGINVGGTPLSAMHAVSPAHVAALSKKPHATDIMQHIIDTGIDLERIEFFEYAQRLEHHIEGRIVTYGVSGVISSLTPLDYAVAVGNVPIVKLLLRNGADVFNTGLCLQDSWWQSLLKNVCCRRAGKNPCDHARAYLDGVWQAVAADTSREITRGTVAEYEKIIKILSKAQANIDKNVSLCIETDLDAVGRCPIQ